MERMTRWDDTMSFYVDENDVVKLFGSVGYSYSGKAIYRLGEYEETGLSPKEIEYMRWIFPRHQQLMKIIETIGGIDEFEKFVNSISKD